jgi:hypothetical protein
MIYQQIANCKFLQSTAQFCLKTVLKSFFKRFLYKFELEHYMLYLWGEIVCICELFSVRKWRNFDLRTVHPPSEQGCILVGSFIITTWVAVDKHYCLILLKRLKFGSALSGSVIEPQLVTRRFWPRYAPEHYALPHPFIVKRALCASLPPYSSLSCIGAAATSYTDIVRQIYCKMHY